MTKVSTLRHINLRAAMAAALALAALGAAEECRAAAAAPPAQPAAIVEVAAATTSRLAPTRWVPGSVVSRDDAKIASAEAGRLEYVAEVGTRLKAGERIA
jgi:multidrug efflux pump subunit AcrA (membrane-fusion protein)